MKINLGDKIYIITKYNELLLVNPEEDSGYHLNVSEIKKILSNNISLTPILGGVYRINKTISELRSYDIYHVKEFKVECWITTDEELATKTFEELLNASENK